MLPVPPPRPLVPLLPVKVKARVNNRARVNNSNSKEVLRLGEGKERTDADVGICSPGCRRRMRMKGNGHSLL